MLKLLYFDPEVGGHHPIYILSLLKYWHLYGKGALVVVLSHQFREVHTEILEEIKSFPLDQVQFQFLTQEENSSILHKNIVLRSFREYKLLSFYGKKNQASGCFINIIDLILLPLALHWNPRQGMKISGILFRPTHHYDQFIKEDQISFAVSLRRLQKKIILQLALKNPALKTVFSLDPYAVSPLQDISSGKKMHYLPEPFLRPKQKQSSRIWENLHLEQERKTFLIFGVLSERKGIFSILQAIRLLAPETARKTCFIFAGKLDQGCGEKFKSEFKEVQKESLAQLILKDEYLSNSEVLEIYSAADCVMAVYNKSFVGSSGVLVWAAATQTPLISTSSGMLGKFVRERKFGITVDPDKPAEIASAMKDLVEDRFIQVDLASMRDYAVENTAENFARTILSNS